MKSRICGEEVNECDGLYLIGGDICEEHYWQENMDSPYFPLSCFFDAEEGE